MFTATRKTTLFHIMGSKLSKLLRSKPAVSPPPPLLQLPIELVLMICEHLDMCPVSYCSLAITCNSLFRILARNGRLHRLNRENFLWLLERDLGDKFYLCCDCAKLRRFYKSWGPTSPDSYQNCERKDNSARDIGPYVLGYHHVRLVMHHHRSGGTKGMPLQNLNQTVAFATLPKERYKAIWRQDWSARIIDDELFLSAHHTLRARNKAQLVRALDWAFYRICNHIRVMPPFQVYDSRCPARLLGMAKACWEVPGSCTKCLTDYILSLERPQEPERHSWRGKWRVSITTYHQVGGGMHPREWKWLAYTKSTHWFDENLYRNLITYPLGSIRETWNSEQS